MQSLSGSLEELVLTALCHNTKLASAIALQIKPELFTTRHFRTIAKSALDHIARYAEAPQNHLPDILESELNKGEQGAILWKTLGRMEEIAGSLQPQYVLSELTQFVAVHNLRLALATASDHLHKGDLLMAQQALHDVNYSGSMTPGIWMNDPDAALRFLDKAEDDEDEFHLGIDALDSRGIKPARKTLLVVMAPKKRGKSMALIGIGKQVAYVDRKKVLHITLEMSEEQVAKRYVQSICAMTASEATIASLRVPLFKRDEQGNFLRMEFDNLLPQALNRGTRKEAASKLRAQHGRKLLIKEFPTGSLTIAQLSMFLDYLKRAENFSPDLLIVDYGNLMHLAGRDTRLAIGQMWRELRGIAVERNMAVVSATQGNRESENARIVGSTHVAEDWSLFGTADIIVTICRTPEEREKRLARLYVAAARDAADQFLVQISQSYETCTFAVDSVYMNKVAIRDFERMMENEGE